MSKYVPPTVTIDGVVFQLVDNELAVLLIQRAKDPFKGAWALPGGYCSVGETTQEALNRILTAKAGISAKQLGRVEQLHTFDAVDRDPRGHAVSITYLGIGKDIEPRTSSSTQLPQFFPINDMPELAYDHKNIIAQAHDRLKERITNTNLAYLLLPKQFTLSQLQSVYEAILVKPLDKRNFRKKFLSLDFVVETDDMVREGAHRPARLYTFSSQSLQTLARNFD